MTGHPRPVVVEPQRNAYILYGGNMRLWSEPRRVHAWHPWKKYFLGISNAPTVGGSTSRYQTHLPWFPDLQVDYHVRTWTVLSQTGTQSIISVGTHKLSAYEARSTPDSMYVLVVGAQGVVRRT